MDISKTKRLMNILYVCHNTYVAEKSGVPLIVDRYAKQCLEIGYKVGILTPSNNKINYTLNKKYKNKINYFNWPYFKNWNIEAFSDNVYDNFRKKIIFNFKPDIVHILDWINIRPDFLDFIKELKVPIVKHVLNFEDYCALTSPIYKNYDAKPCEPRLTAEKCTKCILENKLKKKNFIKKAFSYFNILKKKETNFIKENLTNRFKKVDYINENYFNHLIFPSNSFAKYYLSHSKKKFLKNSIIDLGIKKKQNINNYFSKKKKINIVFLSGGSFRKGWNIIEDAFSTILKKNKGINLKIYGFKKKTSKSKLNKFKNVKFFDSYLEKDLPKILSWSDIGLLPSLFESYSLVLREFIEYNVVPIVIKFMGSEIIKNKINGIIIKNPYVKNLENIINKISTNPSEIQKYKNNLKKTKIIYEKEEFHNILNVYKKLLKNI